MTRSVCRSSFTKVNPLLFRCWSRYLLRNFASLVVGCVVCAANDRANAAWGCETVAMYAPLALSATYWFFVNVSVRRRFIFLVCSGCAMLILLSDRVMMNPLNPRGWSIVREGSSCRYWSFGVVLWPW